MATIAAAQPVAKDEWFGCKKDKECVKVSDVCKGFTAVNKNFKEHFAGYAEAQTALSTCEEIKADEQKAWKVAKPKCVKKECVLTQPEKKK